MSNNDEIPLDVPHRWQVFQLTPPGGFEAGTVTRLGFYRLERDSGEHLTGPVLVDVSNGDQAQVKIIYENKPLAYIEQPTDQERAALLETFKQAAEELNDDERDGALFDKE